MNKQIEISNTAIFSVLQNEFPVINVAADQQTI